MAVVATSAADAEWWIGSRVPDGGRLKGELEELVTDLQKRDTVGKSLQAARQWASDQILAFAGSAISGTWPAWATAAAAGAAAGLTGAAAAGEQTGEVVLPFLLALLLTSGALAIYTIRFSGLLISKASQAGTEALDHLTEKAGGIGKGPEALFESYVRPALTELFTQHGRADERLSGPAPVVGTLRSLAGWSIGLACVALVISLLFFLVGIGDAWETVTCNPDPASKVWWLCPTGDPRRFEWP
ncbi:hypothetical protein ACF06X_14960 [Streptomyces sp. NPDC015346]|uniref:hypothetical protein n=1 Tax=Streptomyces sp. NPDC015346 TaxID=3364954 RepID=UPI0036FF4757